MRARATWLLAAVAAAAGLAAEATTLRASLQQALAAQASAELDLALSKAARVNTANLLRRRKFKPYQVAPEEQLEIDTAFQQKIVESQQFFPYSADNFEIIVKQCGELYQFTQSDEFRGFYEQQLEGLGFQSDYFYQMSDPPGAVDKFRFAIFTCNLAELMLTSKRKVVHGSAELFFLKGREYPVTIGTVRPKLDLDKLYGTVLDKSIPDEPPRRDYYNAVEEGFQLPAVNQGACGSCYSFAYFTTLAARTWLDQGGKLFNLSPQGYLSCYGGRNNDGSNPYSQAAPCSGGGGMEDLAMTAYSADHGVTTFEQTPYTAHGTVCNGASTVDDNSCCGDDLSNCASQKTTGPLLDPGVCPAYTSSVVRLKSKDVGKSLGALANATDNQVMNALLKYGPIAVGVNWMNQVTASGGQAVARESGIPQEQRVTNHAVTLVGYNATGRYYIIRNSHGILNGHSGYHFIGMGGEVSTSESYGSCAGNFCIRNTLFYLKPGFTELVGPWKYFQYKGALINPFPFVPADESDEEDPEGSVELAQV